MLTAEEQPSLLEAMGGPYGAAESALPSVAFVIAYTAGLEVTPAAAVAVAIAAVAGVIRIFRRETVQFAFTGIVGVVISALVASKTGEARNFFLPGLLANVAYAAICLGSVAVRWPFVGVLIAGFSGEEGWRDNAPRMRAFRNATLIFGLIFVLRLVVQVPLYLADATAALGVVKTVMGIPLFGIGIWLSWLMLRGTEPPKPGTAAPAA
ncbi:MAG: DUF3159 domain-containing protein [Solirubrobacteraceae bacterium]|nr:DUF3159 domain-containing protein [Solirubrobacteraceae bacterium]